LTMLRAAFTIASVDVGERSSTPDVETGHAPNLGSKWEEAIQCSSLS
jgi:hypothetical protein